MFGDKRDAIAGVVQIPAHRVDRDQQHEVQVSGVSCARRTATAAGKGASVLAATVHRVRAILVDAVLPEYRGRRIAARVAIVAKSPPP